MIKQIKIMLLLLLAVPVMTIAQVIGIGTQYVKPENGANAFQFQANLSYPVWTKKNPLNTYLSSGIDYTGGSSPVAGLNLKPIQLTSYLSESIFNNWPVTVLVGADAGYLVNFKHGKDGVVLTPHLSIEYSVFYVKSGWDFNVTGKRDQFFVRLGVGFGIGTLKAFAKTRIR